MGGGGGGGGGVFGMRNTNPVLHTPLCRSSLKGKAMFTKTVSEMTELVNQCVLIQI